MTVVVLVAALLVWVVVFLIVWALLYAAGERHL